MATTIDKVLAWIDAARGSELRAVVAKIADVLGPEVERPSGLIFQQAAERYEQLKQLEANGGAPEGTAENFMLNLRAVVNQYGHRYRLTSDIKPPAGSSFQYPRPDLL